MNTKTFHSRKRTPAFFRILGISLFSLSLWTTPTYANSTASAIPTSVPSGSTESTAADTTSASSAAATTTEENDPDLVVIGNFSFRLSSASPETLAAYEAYQKAISYQKDWNMILVNKEHPIPNNYTFTQKTIPGYTMKVDERIYDSLLAMLNDGKKDGCRFLICSAYRPYSRQTEIYNSHIRDFRASGYSEEKAKELTELSIAVPNCSEHQTGLTVDIVATYYQQLNYNFANTKEAKWLKEHAHEYGFILRYPKDKTNITRITFEPWHFRYVGVEAATEIYNLDICYEEYLTIKEQAALDILNELRIQVELDQTYNRKHNPDGRWFFDDRGEYFIYEDNTYPSNAWIQFGENWYYFLSDGYMATGWINLGNSWYYLKNTQPAGEMITGWFLDPETEKWYYLDKDTGEMQTGWFTDETSKQQYYLSTDGSLLTSAFTPDGYYVDENGVYTQIPN